MNPRVYDNGGETADRYTIIPDDPNTYPGFFLKRVMALNLSDLCDHPAGVSQWGPVVEGPNLGRRIHFDDLPERVRAHAQRRLQ